MCVSPTIRRGKNLRDIHHFFLLYGREPMLPIDLELGDDANPRLVTSRTAPAYATHAVTELAKARVLVHTRLGVAQDNQRR